LESSASAGRSWLTIEVRRAGRPGEPDLEALWVVERVEKARRLRIVEHDP
jgi:hypothetical protein